MIDPRELRRLMELEGHDPETVDQFLEWYCGAALTMDQLGAALDLLRQQIQAEAQSLTELIEAVTSGQAPQWPARLPRPPRNTCPKNRAVQQAQRPARVARSSCRKIHK